MYEFNCILKTDLKNLYTNPMWWAGTIGLPLLLALVMGFITKGTYGGVVTSFDYYAITMMIFGALNNADVYKRQECIMIIIPLCRWMTRRKATV